MLLANNMVNLTEIDNYYRIFELNRLIVVNSLYSVASFLVISDTIVLIKYKQVVDSISNNFLYLFYFHKKTC